MPGVPEHKKGRNSTISSANIEKDCTSHGSTQELAVVNKKHFV